MKKNLLKTFALATIIALASCSKDDATTTTPTATEPDPVVLTEEENEEYSIVQADSDESTTEFAEVMESVELPAFKGNADYFGPEICGMKPKGVFNPTTLSYDFVYNFSADGTCDFRGKSISGQVSISVNASKLVTIKFTNFKISSRKTRNIFKLVHTMNGTINMPYTAETSKKYKYSIDVITSVDYKGKKRDRKKRSEGELSIVNTAESITVNYTDVTRFALIKFNAKATNLKLIKSCRDKGFVSGNLEVGNSLNNLKINFGDGTCSNSKWVVTNNGKTAEILLD